MRTQKDVEAYLEKMNRPFSAADQPGTYLVETVKGGPRVGVRVDPPLVVVRVHIGDAKGDQAALFRRLLVLNAKELVHASYGLEGDAIHLAAALELENLDFNELEATLDEIDLALAQQVPQLAPLLK